MKIYRVIFKSKDIDEGDNTVTVTTFVDEGLARSYFQRQKMNLKDQENELDMDNYTVDDDEESYERYLDHRYMEESVSLWLEEDNTYDEIEKQLQESEKENEKNNEKDNNYEM